MIESDKWQKRAFKKNMDSFYYWNYLRNKPISYFLNPKPINISRLFNGVIDCLFCIYFNYCTKDFCIHDFSNIKLTKEQLEVRRLWRGFD